jgi:uncharacterized integral membrane protein
MLQTMGRAEAPHAGADLLAGLLAGEMASGSASVQMLAGLAAIVLGVLAVAGVNQTILTLAALLVLGSAVILTGSALTGLIMGFMRSTPRRLRRRRSLSGAARRPVRHIVAKGWRHQVHIVGQLECGCGGVGFKCGVRQPTPRGLGPSWNLRQGAGADSEILGRPSLGGSLPLI